MQRTAPAMQRNASQLHSSLPLDDSSTRKFVIDLGFLSAISSFARPFCLFLSPIRLRAIFFCLFLSRDRASPFFSRSFSIRSERFADRSLIFLFIVKIRETEQAA